MSQNSDIPNPPTIEKGTYRHYKGKTYEVIGVALHSETLEPVVVYKPLYDSESEFWIRPYAMFTEAIVIGGKSIPRFERIDT